MNIGDRVKTKGSLNCGTLEGNIVEIKSMLDYIGPHTYILDGWGRQLGIRVSQLVQMRVVCVELDEPSKVVAHPEAKLETSFACPECEVELV